MTDNNVQELIRLYKIQRRMIVRLFRILGGVDDESHEEFHQINNAIDDLIKKLQ